MVSHVAVLVVPIGAFGYVVVCVFRVEHAEAVVVLGCEQQVSESGFFHGSGPIGGLEVDGVEFLGLIPIPCLELSVGYIVGFLAAVVHEGARLRAQGPRFDGAANRVDAPMEQHAELLVLPLLQFLLDFGVGGILVGAGTFVDEVVRLDSLVFLCMGHERKREEEG